MIIQLLGANGAGKSTIVKDLMRGRNRVHRSMWNRKVPDGYVLEDLIVVGHYEGEACGGADTLPRRLVLATLAGFEGEQRQGQPIIIEGPTGREPTLETEGLRVVYLRRTPEQCLEDWLTRNRAKGLSTNRATMERRVRAGIVRLDNMMKTYHERGVRSLTTTSRDAAYDYIRRLLGRT